MFPKSMENLMAHSSDNSTPQARPNGNGSSIPDAFDIESLFLDPGLGDGITESFYHTVPVGKPREFFRTPPDQEYRRRAEIYVHKPEGQIDAEVYVIAPNMRGKIIEARPCTLVTIVDRSGVPRIYPVSLPRDGERDNDVWISARAIVRTAMKEWVRMVWHKRAYVERKAPPGYAPDPDWGKLSPWHLAKGSASVLVTLNPLASITASARTA
jgi:hypothetical protein